MVTAITAVLMTVMVTVASHLTINITLLFACYLV